MFLEAGEFMFKFFKRERDSILKKEEDYTFEENRKRKQKKSRYKYAMMVVAGVMVIGALGSLGIGLVRNIQLAKEQKQKEELVLGEERDKRNSLVAEQIEDRRKKQKELEERQKKAQEEAGKKLEEEANKKIEEENKKAKEEYDKKLEAIKKDLDNATNETARLKAENAKLKEELEQARSNRQTPEAGRAGSTLENKETSEN